MFDKLSGYFRIFKNVELVLTNKSIAMRCYFVHFCILICFLRIRVKDELKKIQSSKTIIFRGRVLLLVDI